MGRKESREALNNGEFITEKRRRLLQNNTEKGTHNIESCCGQGGPREVEEVKKQQLEQKTKAEEERGRAKEKK